MRLDLSDTLDKIKNATYDVDKRILGLVGLAAGSFAIYRTLDTISTAGKTELGWLKKIHDVVRIYWNRGAIMKYRHFYHDPRAFVVNYGSYGLIPKPVLRYKWKLQVGNRL